MLKITTKVTVTEPNRNPVEHIGHNAVTNNALNFMARRLAGQATNQTFNDTWSIHFIDSDSNETKMTQDVSTAYRANQVVVKASYTFPANPSSHDWTNHTFALDLTDSQDRSLRVATAARTDFKVPPDFTQVMVPVFAANTKLDLEWIITTAFKAATRAAWVREAIINSNTSNTQSLDTTNDLRSLASHRAIDEAGGGVNIMQIMRGLKAPTDYKMSFEWYKIVNVITGANDDDGSIRTALGVDDDVDVEVLQVITGTTESTSATPTRDNRTLSWTFNAPGSNEATLAFRTRVGVLSWGANVVGHYGFVNVPRSTSTRQVIISGTVRRG